MSDLEDQLRKVCEWNHQLARENATLQIEKHRLEIKAQELVAAHADALTERDAINAALGAAMDAALEVRRP